MIVAKSHKILLETTPEHDRVFVSWCGAARWAYNTGLERKIATYQERERSVGAYALMQEVVALKQTNEYGWLRDIPKSIPRMALMHLDEAFRHFFRRVKHGGEKPGFPKFKSKKRSTFSCHLESDAIRVEGNRVRIPKLGWLKMHQNIRFEGKLVGTVCISKTAGRWSISFTVETEIGDVDHQDKPVTGLDVGVKTLATLSDGTEFENPKAIYRLEKVLARAQRQMARKQKGSKRWQKAKLRGQQIHKRIADVRAQATHQVSVYVARHYSGVAIEDLNVAGMVKNHHLAKAVMNANFAELQRQLEYKMAWSGGEVRHVDRFFPSSRLCACCGCVNENLTLAEREWTCECGTHHLRDVNAAQNLALKCFGRGLTATARGGSGAARPTNETRTPSGGRSKKGDLLNLAL